MMSQIYDTIVVGGGIAGLTSAVLLREAGHTVLLVEASDRVGGVIRTIRRDGFLVETGPNSLLETHPEVGRLINGVGLTEERIYAADTARNRFIVRRGKPVALPVSLTGFLTTPLFSPTAKLRLMAEPFIPRKRTASEESVADFVRRRIGREFLDYAIDPFVSGVYAGLPDELSVKYAFPKLAEIEARYGSLILGQILGARERRKREEKSKTKARMFTFRGGLGQLTGALAARLDSSIRTGFRAGRIVRQDGLWHVTDSAENEVLKGRAVVYAAGIRKKTMGSENRRVTDGANNGSTRNALLSDLVPDVEALATVHYPPLTVVSLGFQREDVAHALDGFGVLVPSVEGRSILGSLFSSTLFPGRAPEGYVLITTFAGGARQPDVALLNDDKLRGIVMDDLSDLLGISGAPVFEQIIRWPHSIPQYQIGYGRVQSALDAAEKTHDGLYFTGNYRAGISVPDTIKHATETAARVSTMLRHAPTGTPALALQLP